MRLNDKPENEKLKWANASMIAIVWIGFVIFVLLLADCALKTLKSGISVF